ncbi:hypothetical protein ACPCG0_00010 [Propionibacteriaceae bacterium Y1923]|uniref:hypothetical protein n=1 Tax=Aestuariimicrobium sp. Y1814 TaxID=3418742 RepID=UPI003C296422
MTDPQERSEDQRGAGQGRDRRSWARRDDDRRSSGAGGRNDRGRDDRRPSGDRGRSERRPYGDRSRDERGGRDDRRPYGVRSRDERGGRDDRRPYGDRSRDDRGGSGERRSSGERGRDDRRPYGDRSRDERGGRDDRRPYGDRSRDERGGRDDRRPYGDRSRDDRGGSGERRSYGERGRDDRRPYGDRSRDDRGGERRSYGDRGRDDRRSFSDRGRDDRGGERRPYSDRGRDDRGTRRDHRGGPGHDPELSREQVRELERAQRPGLQRRDNEPDTPADFDEKTLPRPVRAELRSLPKDLAAIVGAHLAMAGALMDEDPELALAHAQAARRRAARLPVVREATAEAAYAAGDWSTALTEYRALYRMSGSGDYLPVMADCERALGKPREALRLAREASSAQLEPAMKLEMSIVEAGARADLGQVEEALRILQTAITSGQGPKEARARLHYAAADLLEQRGQLDQAADQFQAAARLDPEELLDTAMRLARLGAGGQGAGGDFDIDIIAMDDLDEDTDDDSEEDSDDDLDDEDTDLADGDADNGDTDEPGATELNATEDTIDEAIDKDES